MSSDLHQAVEDYLMVRRTLGAKLERHPRLLDSFVAYLEAAGAATVTTELALAWAWLPGPDAHPSYVGNRLSVVRGFARHLQAFNPGTEVPPAELVPRSKCRATPYLYSDAEITALLTAARSLTPTLRGATYETLIGLLMVTGARVGELIRLDRDHLDWDEGVLVIWDSKFGKSRELALHPGTLDALRGYAALRDRSDPAARTTSFFVPVAGRRLVYRTVQQTFHHLVRDAGLTPRRIGAGHASTTPGITWTATLCALSSGTAVRQRGLPGRCPHNLGCGGQCLRVSSQLISELSVFQSGRTSGVSGW